MLACSVQALAASPHTVPFLQADTTIAQAPPPPPLHTPLQGLYNMQLSSTSNCFRPKLYNTRPMPTSGLSYHPPLPCHCEASVTPSPQQTPSHGQHIYTSIQGTTLLSSTSTPSLGLYKYTSHNSAVKYQRSCPTEIHHAIVSTKTSPSIQLYTILQATMPLSSSSN